MSLSRFLRTFGRSRRRSSSMGLLTTPPHHSCRRRAASIGRAGGIAFRDGRLELRRCMVRSRLLGRLCGGFGEPRSNRRSMCGFRQWGRGRGWSRGEIGTARSSRCRQMRSCVRILRTDGQHKSVIHGQIISHSYAVAGESGWWISLRCRCGGSSQAPAGQWPCRYRECATRCR
jgi:hypothetical protein